MKKTVSLIVAALCIGGVIPYTDTPLKANNTIVAGLIYLIK